MKSEKPAELLGYFRSKNGALAGLTASLADFMSELSLMIEDDLRFGRRLRRGKLLGETLLEIHIVGYAFCEVLDDQRIGIDAILRENSPSNQNCR